MRVQPISARVEKRENAFFVRYTYRKYWDDTQGGSDGLRHTSFFGPMHEELAKVLQISLTKSVDCEYVSVARELEARGQLHQSVGVFISQEECCDFMQDTLKGYAIIESYELATTPSPAKKLYLVYDFTSDDLSTLPNDILEMRRYIREVNMHRCKELLDTKSDKPPLALED